VLGALIVAAASAEPVRCSVFAGECEHARRPARAGPDSHLNAEQLEPTPASGHILVWMRRRPRWAMRPTDSPKA